jgi:hypothetical protein
MIFLTTKSVQNINYIVETCPYIDEGWVLNKKKYLFIGKDIEFTKNWLQPIQLHPKHGDKLIFLFITTTCSNKFFS